MIWGQIEFLMKFMSNIGTTGDVIQIQKLIKNGAPIWQIAEKVFY